MPKVRLLNVSFVFVWTLVFASGCAGFRPIDGLPAQYVPPEVRGESREGLKTIDLSLLRQTPPDTYLVDSGDLLGVYIEGVLGKKEEIPPVHFPADQRQMPSLGYPIPVREDGTISLPLAAPMIVRGLTISQVEEAIRKTYTVDKSILQPGRDRILVSMQRPRTYQVLVIRQEGNGGGQIISEIMPGNYNLGKAKRGTGELVSLPAYKNDVLHALAETGGLPGLDAENTVYVIRGKRRKANRATSLIPQPDPASVQPPGMNHRMPPQLPQQPNWQQPNLPQSVIPSPPIQRYQTPVTPVPQQQFGPAQIPPSAIPSGPPRPGFMQPPPIPRSSQIQSSLQQMSGIQRGHSVVRQAQFVPPAPQPVVPAQQPLQSQSWGHSLGTPSVGPFGGYRWQTNGTATEQPAWPQSGPSMSESQQFSPTGSGNIDDPSPEHWGHSIDTTASLWKLPTGMFDKSISNSDVVRIPIRVHPDEQLSFSEEDILLHDGDIVFIESRETEVFYTGGLLGGGQYAMPRDYDLDVLGAVSVAQDVNTGSAGRSIGGNSAFNQDVTISASDVVILRQMPNGSQVPIKVNLYKAMRDPNERITIQPGDYVVLQYTKWEAVGAFIERHLIEGALFGLAAAQFNRR